MNGFRRALRLTTLLLSAALASACSADSVVPQPRLPTTTACFVTNQKTIPVTLEIAREFEQRQKGLMGRTVMPPEAGMLFVYQRPQSANHGFWMYNTLIPLDIGYVAENGVIGSIRKMAPCTSSRGSNCPTYPAGVEFTFAVEMNDGFFAENGITVGNRLLLGESNCAAD
ncbi:hypothetical protein BKP64_05490 [Marinobacter salinus]|uniref:DUF192 domain-containing protein n=1 Tax=Marinobacter salinus TaxID=1874317 RepID=A0A1D9GJ53_9GAMM|nr:DUF192 domain-containing protein [Marinobacter salinus]AOY87668.1 hypothetical protein BKP64_05490 [Marinobacter salinus]